MASAAELLDLGLDAAPYAFAILFAGLLFVGGVRSLLTGLGIRSREPVPANRVSAETGAVEVEGVARPVDETLTAPVSGAECIGYSRVEKRDFDPNEPRRDRERVDQEEEVVPFFVEDESGRIAVDPSGAALAFQREESKRDRETLEREHRLEPGDEVHVHGQKHDAVEAHDAFPGENVYVGDGDAVTALRISQGDERGVELKLVVLGGVVTLVAGAFLALSVRGALAEFGYL